MQGRVQLTVQDPRATDIGILIATGRVTGWTDIFERIPPAVVAGQLGRKADRFTIAIGNPGILQVGDILRLAEYFQVSPTQLFELIHQHILRHHQGSPMEQGVL